MNIHVIPCLDTRDGRVVKGVQFTNIRDAGDPAACAKAYEQAGADEIVILDISATTEGRQTVTETIEKVAAAVSLPITVGGGIRSVEEARRVIAAGATKVSINSAAVTRPELIQELREAFGKERVVVAIDIANTKDGWSVLTKGGGHDTGIDAVSWAKEAEERGAGAILLTSLDQDGAQTGYHIAATRAVAEAVQIPVIASGGAGRLEHFAEAVLEGKARGVLAASLFHDGVLTVREVKEYLRGCGIPVRWERDTK
jgi:cyclase